MALVKWIFDTQAGSATVGRIKATVTPRSGTTSGYVAFGVTAPNGAVLKSINPSFALSPASHDDMTFTDATPQTANLINIITDSTGSFMSGIYTLKVHYLFNGTYPASETTDDAISEVTYSFCITNSIGNPNKANLTATLDYNANKLYVNDLTDYTGLTLSTHSIASTPIAGGTTLTETGYTQILTLAAYTSVLSANATRLSTTTIGNISVEENITITTSLNTPTDYSNYLSIIGKAETLLNSYQDKLCNQKYLSQIDMNNWLCIISKLAILNSKRSIGQDISNDVKVLNNLLK